MLFAAIGFFNRDIKIAGAAGRIHIRDFKGARRNVALVDLVAVLAHHDLRIGSGNAAYYGRIALKRIRQHVVIGCQLAAAKRHTVEHVGRRRAVANGKLGFQRNNGPLRIGINGIPFILAGGLP